MAGRMSHVESSPSMSRTSRRTTEMQKLSHLSHGHQFNIVVTACPAGAYAFVGSAKPCDKGPIVAFSLHRRFRGIRHSQIQPPVQLMKILREAIMMSSACFPKRLSHRGQVKRVLGADTTDGADDADGSSSPMLRMNWSRSGTCAFYLSRPSPIQFRQNHARSEPAARPASMGPGHGSHGRHGWGTSNAGGLRLR